MENRRARGQGFATFLTLVFALLFIAILASLLFGHLAPEQTTLIGGWGGTILAVLGTAAAYEWGSSKGSAMKDELSARGPQPPRAPETPEPKAGA